jgi:hypothetical protein
MAVPKVRMRAPKQLCALYRRAPPEKGYLEFTFEPFTHVLFNLN